MQNLRFVDTSIVPMETLGNMQATVYAVAEKAADFIKEDAISRDRERKLTQSSRVALDAYRA
jgi:choline dehydrogenase-like flavoprotein